MKNKFFLIASSVLSLFFLTTCGLDTYYTLSPPPAYLWYPSISITDKAQKYFDFYSATNTNTDGSFRFLGTAVYYRIYASQQTMNSHISSISSVNTSSDYSAAAIRMIGYGYQQLYTADGSIQPLISVEGARVRIRLTNNLESVSTGIGNSAQITIINKIPRRALGVNKTFDFGRYEDSRYAAQKDNYAPPVQGDEDFESGTVSDKKYYVNMYAVAVGRDTTYTTYYSNVLHLGSIVIDAGTVDN
ncbi:MAG: hypothetical protein J6V90_06630 [Treponema sp.]|nr:hypothetical protein [Treponema sp.]